MVLPPPNAIHSGIILGGYAALFIAILVEGPAVTAAGGFAAHLGYMNLWAVFLLSILGNIIPDIFLYTLGFWGRMRFVHRFGRYFGITTARVEAVERIYESHGVKMLFISKLIPLLAPVGLVAAGLARMPLGKYALWSILIILPTSAGFLAVGYYFGSLYAQFVQYGGYALAAVGVAIIALTYGYRKFSQWVGERIGKNTTV